MYVVDFLCPFGVRGIISLSMFLFVHYVWIWFKGPGFTVGILSRSQDSNRLVLLRLLKEEHWSLCSKTEGDLPLLSRPPSQQKSYAHTLWILMMSETSPVRLTYINTTPNLIREGSQYNVTIESHGHLH